MSETEQFEINVKDAILKCLGNLSESTTELEYLAEQMEHLYSSGVLKESEVQSALDETVLRWADADYKKIELSGTAEVEKYVMRDRFNEDFHQTMVHDIEYPGEHMRNLMYAVHKGHFSKEQEEKILKAYGIADRTSFAEKGKDVLWCLERQIRNSAFFH